ncbi:MAG: YihA family ribosome biogenesis GTP-binding protein [Acholeplasmataceae bacterium]|nr:YihA family ribosome biogenesis GTP-binding protein [Acholeplasmataceae bacterium]
METKFLKSVFNMKQLDPKTLPEILLVGRSNVGKSSFINALLNRKNIARTSSTPGKTISLNYFQVSDGYFLVDAPGYGYAKRSKAMQDDFLNLMNSYLSLPNRIDLVLLLIDFRVGPTEDDLVMLNYLLERKLNFQIILTKADKVKMSERVKKLRMIEEKTYGIPHIITSAETKMGYNKVNELIKELITGGQNEK